VGKFGGFGNEEINGDSFISSIDFGFHGMRRRQLGE